MQEFIYLTRRFFGFLKKEKEAFFLYSLAYAVLGLIIPFVVQLIVNQLAMAGLTQNWITLGVLVGFGLGGFYLLKLTQIILLEYVQRKIKVQFIKFFQKKPDLKIEKKWYFFEINAIQKKIGSWAMDGFELTLTIFVGLVALIFYHPLFLFLSIYVCIILWLVCFLGKDGLRTSLEESDQKYKVFSDIAENSSLQTDLTSYFVARHRHFIILKKQSIVLLFSQWFGQVIVLFGGLLLVELEQLGLGQFVAAEIIASSIFISLNKAPKFIENHFDLFTSVKKISRVVES